MFLRHIHIMFIFLTFVILILTPAQNVFAQCESQIILADQPNGSGVFSMDIHEDVMAIGDIRSLDLPGVARIYRFNYGQWNFEQLIRTTFDDPEDAFGGSIATNGEWVAVADHFENGGIVYLYRYIDGVWNLRTTLSPPPNAIGKFGRDIDLDDNLLIVGAPFAFPEGLSETGAVVIYRFDGKSWNLDAELYDPEPVEAFDLFGWNVEIDGDTAIIGAHGKVDTAGRAYIYKNTDEGWIMEETLTPQPPDATDWFGRSVAIEDNIAIAGAPMRFDPSGLDGGVYTYINNGNGWEFEDLLLPHQQVGMQSLHGWSVDLNARADSAIIGSPFDSEIGFHSGAVYIHHRSEKTGWDQGTKILASDGQPGDEFGWNVALDDDTALIRPYAAEPNQIYVISGVSGIDCNNNGVADACDIFEGTSVDDNGDGVPDECALPGDLDGDLFVDGSDLGVLLGAWGQCPSGSESRATTCPGDLNDDGTVDGEDLGVLLGAWSPQPPPLETLCPAEGDCCDDNNSPGCDDPECCQSVCEVDDYCCLNAWDHICAEAAQELCGCPPPASCGRGDGSGDCCALHGNGTPGCDDVACCDAVCEIDPYCCDTEWDDLCYGASQVLCGCPAPPICGDPQNNDCCTHDPFDPTPGCSDEACCEQVCEIDGFCCQEHWDSICSGIAQDICEICQE